jgi:hypothetical protein
VLVTELETTLSVLGRSGTLTGAHALYADETLSAENLGICPIT